MLTNEERYKIAEENALKTIGEMEYKNAEERYKIATDEINMTVRYWVDWDSDVQADSVSRLVKKARDANQKSIELINFENAKCKYIEIAMLYLTAARTLSKKNISLT